MLVQTRSRTLRLIRQHDHAIASGEMAHAWSGVSGAPRPLSHEAVLAIALHDMSWRETDREPRHDPATGGAVDFAAHPLAERLAFYAAGLDEVERIHPYAALLGSLHYARLMEERAPAFASREKERRARLEAEPGIRGRAEREEDLAHLRFLDNLSLFVCLTGPGAVDPPEWLSPEEVGRSAPGAPVALSWADPGTLRVDPFPFRAPLALRIPCRDLPRAGCGGAGALREAWLSSLPTLHEVRLLPADT